MKGEVFQFNKKDYNPNKVLDIQPIYYIANPISLQER
jgi:hypothetical protein